MLKWDLPEYWDNIILKSKDDIIFKSDRITESTVFAHFNIVNAYSNEIYDVWMKFPCIEAFFGYLKFQYLPLVIFSLFDPNNEIEGTESVHVNDVIELTQSSSIVKDKSMIGSFKSIVQQIYLIGENEYDRKLISELINQYNNITKGKLDKFSSMDLFFSADELGRFIIAAYEDSPLEIGGFIEDFDMTKEEFLDICSQCYSNKFIEQKLLDIIYNKLTRIMI